MEGSKPLVLFLMGPTASGKTGLAMRFADILPIRLISVDSTQVYRGLDIGSAKPDSEQLRRYPHQLINICNPAEPYSVARFVVDAKVEITRAIEEQKIPLLVGGSMLYYRALLEGLADIPAPDLEVRAKIEEEAKQFGWPFLHAQLCDVDPDLAGALHPNHSQRIQRGLEVFRQTGRTLTEWRERQPDKNKFLQSYDVRQLALVPENRKQLHQVIAMRFAAMVEQGLLEEVRGLRERGDLNESLPAIRSVGYRQAWQFLAGEVSSTEWIENAVAVTRQLAKRQLTWIRSWPSVNVVDPQAMSTEELIQTALKQLGLSQTTR